MKNSMDKSLIAALREAESRERVEDIFERFKLNNKETSINIKLDYLEAAMHNPQVFYSSGNNTKLETKYYLAIQRLLAGKWKLRELYIRAGFIKEHE